MPPATSQPALIDVVRPEKQEMKTLRDVALVLLGAALLAISAQVVIVIPFSPVPISGQTFAVLLLGAALGRWRGSAAIITYLLQGAAGLPIFAGGLAGPAVIAGPTGGYLLGFIAAAWLVGMMAEHGWGRTIWSALLMMVAGTVVIYMVGVPWLTHYLPLESVLAAGLLPFLPGDVLKLVLAAGALQAGWAVVRQQHPYNG